MLVYSPRRLRKQRARARQPRRILIPVGGAGAQKSFVSQFIQALGSHVAEGKVQLMLNAGDHEHMRVAFAEALAAIGVSDYAVVDSMEGVHEYAERLRSGVEPTHAVTLFAFKQYFPAVATAGWLARSRPDGGGASVAVACASRRQPTSSPASPTCSRASRPSLLSTRCPS